MLSQKGLHLRAALFRAIRIFFEERGFLEVDTPLRQTVILPESTIIPIRSEDCFLQASPELYMKRLLARGCEKIFQICHCFRKEERGRLHLEEFMMLEWYRLGKDYSILMDDCEKLVTLVAEHVAAAEEDYGCLDAAVLPHVAKTPWDRVRVDDAFSSWAPMSVDMALERDLFDEILVEDIEPRLGFEKPVFLVDYPASRASLAKRKDTEPDYAERFELYINGVEIANGFSELTDVEEQRHRFTEEIEEIEKQGAAKRPMPELFLQELGRIERAAGIALGVDRLFMLLLGEKDIANVVSFSDRDDAAP